MPCIERVESAAAEPAPGAGRRAPGYPAAASARRSGSSKVP